MACPCALGLASGDHIHTATRPLPVTIVHHNGVMTMVPNLGSGVFIRSAEGSEGRIVLCQSEVDKLDEEGCSAPNEDVFRLDVPMRYRRRLRIQVLESLKSLAKHP